MVSWVESGDKVDGSEGGVAVRAGLAVGRGAPRIEEVAVGVAEEGSEMRGEVGDTGEGREVEGYGDGLIAGVWRADGTQAVNQKTAKRTIQVDLVRRILFSWNYCMSEYVMGVILPHNPLTPGRGLTF
jgi:hypothetical protein